MDGAIGAEPGALYAAFFFQLQKPLSVAYGLWRSSDEGFRLRDIKAVTMINPSPFFESLILERRGLDIVLTEE